MDKFSKISIAIGFIIAVVFFSVSTALENKPNFKEVIMYETKVSHTHYKGEEKILTETFPTIEVVRSNGPGMDEIIVKEGERVIFHSSLRDPDGTHINSDGFDREHEWNYITRQVTKKIKID